MRDVAILVFDGVADGPFGISLDVLGAAVRIARTGLLEGVTAPTLRVRVLSIDGEPVRSAAGRTIEVDGPMRRRRWKSGDVALLPGMGMATEPEIAHALRRPDLLDGMRVVARASEAGALVAASCSATFVLGAAGLLDGREATTTWWLAPAFARLFPRAKLRQDRMVVSAGNVITAGSALAHADLMLTVVARLSGDVLANTVARYLVLDDRPSQARYMVHDHVRTTDAVVRSLELYIRKNLHRRLTNAELAKATATSPRTLSRRLEVSLGLTPLRLVQRLRVERAVHLLETGRASIDDVAAQVGYADASAFRRVLRRETGQSARDVRAGRGAAARSRT